MRFHPILKYWKLHDGTDFGAGCGTPLRAPYNGRVAERYYNAGYGNRLMIDHGVVDGRFVTTGYNHAIRYTVGVGDRVSKGEVIGYVGSTGYSTGCHLHLMVWLDGNRPQPDDLVLTAFCTTGPQSGRWDLLRNGGPRVRQDGAHGEGEGSQGRRAEPQGSARLPHRRDVRGRLALSGTEVKSLREGRATLADAFATVDDGEVWLRAAHIPEYSHGTWTNHTARRTRKLLLHRREIDKIARELETKGSHAGAARHLLRRRVRQGRARHRHRQAGVRQAPVDRPAGGATGRRSGPWPAGPAARGAPLRHALRRLLLASGRAAAAPSVSRWPRPTTASAAVGTRSTRSTIEYEMGTDGVLQAKETIVYRFGYDSGRHGIDRYFVTREPYDDHRTPSTPSTSSR